MPEVPKIRIREALKLKGGGIVSHGDRRGARQRTYEQRASEHDGGDVAGSDMVQSSHGQPFLRRMIPAAEAVRRMVELATYGPLMRGLRATWSRWWFDRGGTLAAHNGTARSGAREVGEDPTQSRYGDQRPGAVVRPPCSGSCSAWR